MVDVFFVAECAQAKVSFAGGAESRTRCSDHMGFIEQFIEEFPTIDAVGGFHPYVWCIYSAETADIHAFERRLNFFGVFHVVDDQFLAFFLSLVKIGRYSIAALIKPENKGCPSLGVEVNSG